MMEKMMLNLNSLATMLFTCDLHAYKDAVFNILTNGLKLKKI